MEKISSILEKYLEESKQKIYFDTRINNKYSFLIDSRCFEACLKLTQEKFYDCFENCEIKYCTFRFVQNQII